MGSRVPLYCRKQRFLLCGLVSVRKRGHIQRTVFLYSVLTEPSGQPILFSTHGTNAVCRMKSVWFGKPGNYGLIPIRWKGSLSYSKCWDELRETFGIPFCVYRCGRGELQRQKWSRREVEHCPGSNSVPFIFGTHWIWGLVDLAVSLDTVLTVRNWYSISNGL